jgi:hypothetical protein
MANKNFLSIKLYKGCNVACLQDITIIQNFLRRFVLTQIKSILDNPKVLFKGNCQALINNLYQWLSCLYNLSLCKKVSVLFETLRQNSVALDINKITNVYHHRERREVIGDTSTVKYNSVVAVKRLISHGSYTVQF